MCYWQVCSPITIGSLFILMIVSLTMWKVFNLMYSHVFFFPLYFPFLGDISVKILPHGISEILLRMFSARTFMVSQLNLSPLSILGLFWCMM